jgi:hypothetical protein
VETKYVDVAKYLEKKRGRLEEIAAAVTRLRGEIEALGQEEVKVRTQIETAEDMAREQGQVVAAIPKAAEKPGRSSRRKKPERKPARPAGVTLIEAIRQVIRDLPAPFSTGDVRGQLQERYPELVEQTHYSSIAGTMRRMGVKGDLEPIEKGGPGKEATYRLASSTTHLQEPRSGDRADHQQTVEEERDLVESAR